jgi:hypothetical protein
VQTVTLFAAGEVEPNGHCEHALGLANCPAGHESGTQDSPMGPDPGGQVHLPEVQLPERHTELDEQSVMGFCKHPWLFELIVCRFVYPALHAVIPFRYSLEHAAAPTTAHEVQA